jgi:membrane-bound serine protease (ClpP class)
MIGQIGEALEDLTPEGRVRWKNETWQAAAVCPIPQGIRVRIVGINGMVLLVEPLEAEGAEGSTQKEIR